MGKYAIIDSGMSDKCQKSLKKIGLNLIKVPKNPNLDYPIAGHPDISVFCYKNTLIAEETIFPNLGNINFPNIFTEHLFDENTRYPNDCVLNFAVCGNNIIGNMKHMNRQIQNIAEAYNMNKIDVKQGYAKCNICIVGDNAIITEDAGIAKACVNHNIDVLLLKEKCVRLDGYKNGFIGGASGLLKTSSKNMVMFCGDIQKHAEYNIIEKFCCRHGAETLSLTDEELYDCGSIILI